MLFRYLNAYVLFPLLEKKTKRLIAPKVLELRQFEKLSVARQNEIRRTELHKLLVHARANIPYYQDLFKSVGFDENKVLADIRYVEKLPVLTKEIVRENTERLRMPNAHHPRKTGGSTGQSVFFYYDNEGLDWTSAINLCAYEMAGKYPHHKDSHISASIDVGPVTRKDKLADWLKLFSQNRSRVMVRSFSDTDLRESFEALNSRRPYLLQGHPSSGYAIANYVAKHGLQGPKYCSVFEPSGETITEKMAQAIESNLGCKVVNRYGNAEVGVMAHSRAGDSFQKLQIFNRAFHMEPVEKGNLIVTAFTNYGFPLLRYDTGDIGTIRDEADGSFIYDLQGRVHDMVTIGAETYATHYIMDYLDHKIRRVREFQILVGQSKEPILTIVPEDESDIGRIREMLIGRWPSGISFKFIRYEELERVGWQNKFRHVINKSQTHEHSL